MVCGLSCLSANLLILCLHLFNCLVKSSLNQSWLWPTRPMLAGLLSSSQHSQSQLLTARSQHSQSQLLTARSQHGQGQGQGQGRVSRRDIDASSADGSADARSDASVKSKSMRVSGRHKLTAGVDSLLASFSVPTKSSTKTNSSPTRLSSAVDAAGPTAPGPGLSASMEQSILKRGAKVAVSGA
jgi:hypothetical protein